MKHSGLCSPRGRIVLTLRRHLAGAVIAFALLSAAYHLNTAGTGLPCRMPGPGQGSPDRKMPCRQDQNRAAVDQRDKQSGNGSRHGLHNCGKQTLPITHARTRTFNLSNYSFRIGENTYPSSACPTAATGGSNLRLSERESKARVFRWAEQRPDLRRQSDCQSGYCRMCWSLPRT